MIQLPEAVKVVSREGNKAKFEISPLMPGYGATVANSMRRILLSSLGGAAVTSIKIRGVDHQFSSIAGIMEDVIEVILNVKKIRFKSFSDQPILTVEKGIGYVPIEQRQKDKLAIGVIAVDAIFSPVRNVNFTIDDIRVGQRIDYNKATMEIETDGSITPEEAFKSAADILVNHFTILTQVEIPTESAKPVKRTRKPKAVEVETE